MVFTRWQTLHQKCCYPILCPFHKKIIFISKMKCLRLRETQYTTLGHTVWMWQKVRIQIWDHVTSEAKHLPSKLHSILPSIYDIFCACAKSVQLYPTLCDPMDCGSPGSSVHGILQTRILEWVAMPSSRRSSQPRSPTWQVDSLPSEPPGIKEQNFTPKNTI